MTAKDAAGAARADARRRSPRRPVVFVAGGTRFRDPPDELGVAAGLARRRRRRAAPGRRLRPAPRLQAARRPGLRRRRDAADERPATGRSHYELDLIAKRRRPRRRATRALVRHGTRDRRRRPRGRASCSTAGRRAHDRPAARLARPRAPGPSSCRCGDRRRDVVRCRLAAPLRRPASRSRRPSTSSLGKTRWLLTPRRIASLLAAAVRRADDAADRRARRRPLARRASASAVAKPPKDATFAVDGTHVSVVPAQPGVQLDALASAAGAAQGGAAPDAAASPSLPLAEAQPQALDRRRARDGDQRRRRRATRRITAAIPNRIHNVQLVAHLIDDKLIAPGATFSFNQTTGERTAAKGFLEAPVIVNGELHDRARRRRLPGLDDGLQRRVRGRAEDHRADEPRALHQPLPAGARRDRQLSGRRPEVRQRHGALAAAAHVRRLVVADRQPLRDAAAPAGREHDCAARRARVDRRSRRRSTRRCSRARRSSTIPVCRAHVDERHARRLRAERQAAVPRHVVLVVPRRRRSSCASARRRRRSRLSTTTTQTQTRDSAAE